MNTWPPWIEALKTQGTFLLSASSYSLAKRCLRRWAFKYIGKIREEQTPAQAFGTRAHAQAEQFLRDGTAPDLETREGRCVVESFPHLPRPGESLPEVPFAFQLDGAWFWGWIDAVHEAAARKIDHKFVGSLDYAHTPESLVQDPAAVLYTLAPPAFPTTHLRWIYNLKTRRRSVPVDADLEFLDALAWAREHLVPAWHLLSGIHALFAGQSPEDALPSIEAVPCNPADCLAFNRPCIHMAYCSRKGHGTL